MKAIFFDIDGVLNSNKFICNSDGEYISPDNVRNLATIAKATDAKLILTCDWRGGMKKADLSSEPELQELVDKLAAEGLEIHGITPTLEEMSGKNDDYGRAYEIREYVKKNDVTSYVILDDMDLNWEKTGMFDRWVDTENVVRGLTEADARMAIDILNN